MNLLRASRVDMIFKDLQKLVQSSRSNSDQTKLFERLKNKPFWTWDVEQHKLEDIKQTGTETYFCV
jgi:hypothetical protein